MLKNYSIQTPDITVQIRLLGCNIAVFSMIMGLSIYVMYITNSIFRYCCFGFDDRQIYLLKVKKYNVDLIKTLMFNNKKKKIKRHIVVENEYNYCDIVDRFAPKDYNIVLRCK